MKLSESTFRLFCSDPDGYSDLVRQELRLPDNRYFSVSIWPECVAGKVWLTGKRTEPVRKISKSDS
jgi:hypothetical protein